MPDLPTEQRTREPLQPVLASVSLQAEDAVHHLCASATGSNPEARHLAQISIEGQLHRTMEWLLGQASGAALPATRNWAGAVLATVCQMVDRNSDLLRENKRFAEVKRNLARKNLRKGAPLTRIVWEEVERASQYRDNLMLAANLDEVARAQFEQSGHFGIPTIYRQLVKMEPFHNDWQRWFDEVIWPALKRREQEIFCDPAIASMAKKTRRIDDLWKAAKDAAKAIAMRPPGILRGVNSPM